MTATPPMDGAVLLNPDPQYRIKFSVQKDGDTRTLEVESEMSVLIVAENPLIGRLIKTHTFLLEKHDAGELVETPDAGAPAPEGRPN